MRFVKLTAFYVEYLQQFYGRHPLLALLPFDRQRSRLLEDGFGWADFFQHALRPLGYDAHELVINAKPLQRAWALEHGVTFPSERWDLEIAYHQVTRANPEILFLDSTNMFPLPWIERVRASCPALRLVVGWAGTPSDHHGALSAYDAVLSCVPELVTALEEGGKRSFHLHHAFAPRVLAVIDQVRAPDLEFSFVGQIVGGSDFHGERMRLLLSLAERTNIQIYSPSMDVSLRARAKRRLKPRLKPVAALIDALPVPSRLRRLVPLPAADSGAYERAPEPPAVLSRRLHPPVFGLDMYQRLHDSRATFNCHLGASRRSASNMRLFEATGVGSCLVTDLKDNLPSLFAPDEEVVTYQSLDECVEKVKWLADNPAQAAAIGRKAMHRTLRDHTYELRAARLDELLRELLR
jgi:hypothetical protein